jgi:broad specificity phosphatase PhoE
MAPDIIYLIRHGEKPADPPSTPPPFGIDVQGVQDGSSLLPRGWQRSGALTDLFDPATGPLQAGLQTPATLLSPSYGDPGKTTAHRTYQTIQGLSERLGIAIASDFAEGQEPQLAANVVSTGSGIVLICWEHDHIPALATALPTVSGTSIPQAWPGDRFDLIWMFTLVPGADPAQYTFDQIPQQLLSGDTNTVILA